MIGLVYYVTRTTGALIENAAFTSRKPSRSEKKRVYLKPAQVGDSLLDPSRVIDGRAPDEALVSLSRLVSDPDSQATRRRSLLEAWARQDPAAAAAWLISNVSGQSDWRGVMAIWTHENAPAAGDWLNTQERGPVFDMAAAAFVDALATTDPKLATRWASAIGNPIDQTRALRSSLTGWYKEDPAAALTWVGDSGLPIHLLGLPAEDTPASPSILIPSILKE